MPGIVTITGAGGFVGGRVAAHAVRALPGRQVRLVTHNRPSAATGAPEVETLPGDLTDPGSLRGLCADSDTLIHCASRIAGPEELCRAVNAHGTEALLAEARRSGVRRIVYLSTAAVYGPGPFHGARPADLPLAPASATSRSRAAAEQAVLDAGGIVLRPHLVYGTGDRWVGPGLLRLARALDADVDGWPALLSAVDVDDLARALLATALAPADRLASSVYHANHPRPVPAAELVGALAGAAGLRPPRDKLTAAQARARLAEQGLGTHDLDLVAADHVFDSAPLWSDLGQDPGPGFTDRFPYHAAWYGSLPLAE